MSLETLSDNEVASVMLGSFYQHRYTSTVTMIGMYRLQDDDLPIPMDEVPESGFGMALVDIDAEFKDGIARYVWTYEGVNNIFFAANYPVLDINGSTNQEPITSHPNIDQFIAKYSNGPFINGRIDWRRDDPDGNSGIRGLSATGNKVVQNISPLYGMESYQAPTASYSYEGIYKKDELPEDLVSTLGQIAKELPDISGDGGLKVNKDSSSTTKKNWLYSGVRLFQQGDAFVVRKYFQLSGPGGWMPQLYDPSWTPPVNKNQKK